MTHFCICGQILELKNATEWRPGYWLVRCDCGLFSYAVLDGEQLKRYQQ